MWGLHRLDAERHPCCGGYVLSKSNATASRFVTVNIVQDLLVPYQLARSFALLRPPRDPHCSLSTVSVSAKATAVRCLKKSITSCSHPPGIPAMGDNESIPPSKPLPPTPAGAEHEDVPVDSPNPDILVDESNSAYPPRSSSYSHNFSRKPVIGRKPVPGQENVKAGPSRYRARRTSSGQLLEEPMPNSRPSSGQSTPSRDEGTSEGGSRDSDASLPPTQTLPLHPRHVRDQSDTLPRSYAAEMSQTSAPIPEGNQSNQGDSGSATEGGASYGDSSVELLSQPQHTPQPQYPNQPRSASARYSHNGNLQPSPNFLIHHSNNSVPELRVAADPSQRPHSTLTVDSGSDGNSRGRPHTRHLSAGGSPSPSGSPVIYARGHSNHRYSPDNRPASYVDLLNVPYPQQVAPAPSLDNSMLRSVVGSNASLLDAKKTLEMYRANVKKTNDPEVQYNFALLMVQLSRESTSDEESQNMLAEAKQILQKLSDRSFPFAQYYLADGYFSGAWSKGKEDHDRAFPLFIAASKHGHAESAYRAALCYEFGWGCRKDYAKAAQYYRTAASKNHPGAATRLGLACLQGTMGLNGKYREGVKWLKRAAESADFQYNAAPFELARLHENGYGDDIFKDEAYAAQLYTQSADLGHAEANLIMGKAYEHGLLGCPKDAALSIHFYNGAAQAGNPEAMMALCAWYMFGAEPILAKDDSEAYEWAKRAADLGKLLPVFMLLRSDLRLVQSTLKRSTPSVTSRRWASAVVRTRSRPMFGTYALLSRTRSEPSRDSPLFELRRKEMVRQIYHLNRMGNRRKVS